MANHIEVKKVGRGGYYKGFFISFWKSRYQIHNNNGEVVRRCKTLKECKERIDTQTV